MNCNANKCIECTVQQCAHHCQGENYCSLNKILVGTHESDTLCCSYKEEKIKASGRHSG